MKNSYKITGDFPKFALPLNKEEMAQVGTACILNAQTKFVAKSDRLRAMQEELENTKKLCASAERVASMWTWRRYSTTEKDPRKPTFSYEPLPYETYDKEIGDAISNYLTGVAQASGEYVDAMSRNAANLRALLNSTRDALIRDIDIEKKGAEGESRVEAYLRTHVSGEVMANVVLPAVRYNENDPQTAETDILVICRLGAFVCEVKNYGNAGLTIEVQPDGQFDKKDYYGRLLEHMGYPFAQNTRHHQAVKQALCAAGLREVPVYPVVIIANPDVNIVNHSNQWVMDVATFCNALDKGFGTTSLSPDLQQAAKSVIQQSRMGERKFPIVSISAAANYYSFAISQMENAWTVHKQWKADTEAVTNKWVAQIHEQWVNAHPVLTWFGAFLTSGDTYLLSSFFAWVGCTVMAVMIAIGSFSDMPPGILRFLVVGIVSCFWGSSIIMNKESVTKDKKYYVSATKTGILRDFAAHIGRRLLLAVVPAVVLLLWLVAGVSFS